MPHHILTDPHGRVVAHDGDSKSFRRSCENELDRMWQNDDHVTGLDTDSVLLSIRSHAGYRHDPDERRVIPITTHPGLFHYLIVPNRTYTSFVNVNDRTCSSITGIAQGDDKNAIRGDLKALLESRQRSQLSDVVPIAMLESAMETIEQHTLYLNYKNNTETWINDDLDALLKPGFVTITTIRA